MCLRLRADDLAEGLDVKRRIVVVVGSSTFPITPELGAEVVDMLRTYPIDSTVFVTRGSVGFDQFICGVGPIIGYPVLVAPSEGNNWQRDVDMVKEADEVLAFFDPETIGDERTGTAHVVTKALDQKKPVRAYTAADRHLVYAGSLNEKEG